MLNICQTYSECQLFELATAIAEIAVRLNIHPTESMEITLNDFNTCMEFINGDIDRNNFIMHFTNGLSIDSLADDPELPDAIYTLLMGIFGIQNLTNEDIFKLIEHMNNTSAWEYLACCGRHMASYPYDSISEDIQFFMASDKLKVL